MSLGPYDDYVSYKSFDEGIYYIPKCQDVGYVDIWKAAGSSLSSEVLVDLIYGKGFDKGAVGYGLTVAGGSVSTDYNYPLVPAKPLGPSEPATINNPQWGYNTLQRGRLEVLTDEEYAILADIRAKGNSAKVTRETITITVIEEKKGRRFKEAT